MPPGREGCYIRRVQCFQPLDVVMDNRGRDDGIAAGWARACISLSFQSEEPVDQRADAWRLIRLRLRELERQAAFDLAQGRCAVLFAVRQVLAGLEAERFADLAARRSTGWRPVFSCTRA